MATITETTNENLINSTKNSDLAPTISKTDQVTSAKSEGNLSFKFARCDSVKFISHSHFLLFTFEILFIKNYIDHLSIIVTQLYEYIHGEGSIK